MKTSTSCILLNPFEIQIWIFFIWTFLSDSHLGVNHFHAVHLISILVIRVGSKYITTSYYETQQSILIRDKLKWIKGYIYSHLDSIENGWIENMLNMVDCFLIRQERHTLCLVILLFIITLSICWVNLACSGLYTALSSVESSMEEIVG